jgi:predicted XRE-type DNA-binding protein
MRDDNTIHRSRGNVFADLGLADADLRLAKAHLARIAGTVIRDRRLTQTEAARLMRLEQPDVSDIVRGRLARFSLERLERGLQGLDMDITIRVQPRSARRARARLTVEYLPA